MDPAVLAGSPGDQDERDRNAVLSGFFACLVLATAGWWAANQWLPDTAAVRLAGHAITIGDLHRRVFSTALLLVFVIPTIFMIELYFVGWRRSSLRLLVVEHTPSSLTDLACFLSWQARIMTVLTVVMSLGLALLSGTWVHERLEALSGLSVSLANYPLPVQWVGFFLVYSFCDYWAHRLDHSPLFWPLHRFHHAADDFCVLNSVRTHPAVFTDLVAITLPAALCGVSPEVIIEVNFFVLTLRYLIHSRIDSNWGWVGRWLLQSPTHHRLHHILDISQPVGHFGLMPLWDRLFGTWRGEADQRLVIGVDKPYRHGAWLGPDLWRDYCEFWAGFRFKDRSASGALAASQRIGVDA